MPRSMVGLLAAAATAMSTLAGLTHSGRRVGCGPSGLAEEPASGV